VSTLVDRPPSTPAPPPSVPARRRQGLLSVLVVAGLAAGALLYLLVGVALWAVTAQPIALVVWLSLPFLFVLVARPVLRRLAVRNATRRPKEALLVVLGSLLGTAIITGSFVVGDTLDASIRRGAETQLGPVDVAVVVEGTEASADVDAALRDLPTEDVDGVLRATTVTAAVASTGGVRRADPSASIVELDFDDAAAFGGDPGATGIDGPTPAEGRAAVGRDLADTLGVTRGDTVELYAYGQRLELSVERVLARRGLAGLRLGFGGSESPNLFVAPGTIAGLADGAGDDAAPPDGLVLVSAVGGVFDGADRTDAVVEEIEAALGDRPASVFEAKRETLDAAEASGEEFTTLFTSIGLFSVLAGMLLLVNIFVALAQERKTQLGMLRAVGLRRSGLVASFGLEGWLYAVTAAAAGTLVGLGLGRLIVVVASGIFSQGDASLELGFAVDAPSLATGFSVGFLIALVTVLGASLQIARLNVIRAIRDLPEPVADRRTRLATVIGGGLLGLLGALVTLSGAVGDEPFSILGGPGLIGLGLVLALRPVVPRRLLVTAVGAAVIIWSIVVFDLFAAAFGGADIPIFVLQGVLLTAASVGVVSVNQDVIGAALRRVGGGSGSVTLHLGLAYPLARRFRTAMILGMYVLVVFTLTFIVSLTNLFAGQVDSFTEDVAGGYDLVVESNGANPVPVAELAGRDDVEAVAELAVVGAEFEVAGRTDGFEAWGLAGIDAAYFDRGRQVSELGDRYATSDEVWDAVIADPSLILVTEFFLQDGGGGPPAAGYEPGTTLQVRDPLSGRERTVTIAGVLDSSFGNDLAFVSREGLDDLFGERTTGNVAQVAAAGGVDGDALADELNGLYLANGADAETFRSIVEENLSIQIQFFRLIQGYLALGLLVGIAGLGVVAVRAVRERRRQVGVLRSLGFSSQAVRRAFLTESAFVALEGILLGVVLGLVTAWRLIGSDSFGEDSPFSVPWLELAILVVSAFVASLLATAAPAQQASRIRPAVALRSE